MVEGSVKWPLREMLIPPTLFPSPSAQVDDIRIPSVLCELLWVEEYAHDTQCKHFDFNTMAFGKVPLVLNGGDE